eukprot:945500-Pyramimonas_sp.AAC.1
MAGLRAPGPNTSGARSQTASRARIAGRGLSQPRQSANENDNSAARFSAPLCCWRRRCNLARQA